MLEDQLLEWCEEQELDLTAKKRKALIRPAVWEKHKKLVDTANRLMHAIGIEEFRDFNVFSRRVNKAIKAQKLKLSAGEKNSILNAVSWYDEEAEKVIKKRQKLSGDKKEALLEHLSCREQDLPDYGYYPTGKPGEYLIYESESDLRDAENIPLKDDIHAYFLREVKPHVEEAWIDLDKTKMGYEISFNKYFYQHKPLRSLEEVTQDILELEKENEGLIMDILNL
jgi:type I restriction enzyme M protein